MHKLAVRRFPVRNLPALLRSTAKRVGSRRFLRELNPDSPSCKPTERSFEQFENEVAATAEYLAQSGVKPFDRVLFVAENSRHYQVVSLAVQALRAEPCVVFANLNATGTCDIAQRVRPRCLFVSNQSQWEKLTPVASTLVATGLTLRISTKPLDASVPGVTDCLAADISRSPFTRALWDKRVDAVGPNDPFLLLFTSGTTGKQKGVILRQDAFVRALEGGQAATAMSETDDGLMFLPFAHVAGQCQFMLAVALGHSLILVSRRDDLPLAFSLGPTYSFAVPMVYAKLLGRVAQQVDATRWPLRPLLSACLAAAANDKGDGLGSVHNRVLSAFARKTIGKRFLKSLGGRLRMVASCGASVPPSLCQSFESLGIPFISFYGMSETSGLICSQCVDTGRHGNDVGLPSPDLELKICDNGELRLKGSSLMEGYLDAEDNAAGYDEHGYFRTGDLVNRTPQTGELRIVGRAKNLLILSTGKNVSPEPIEARLETIPHIAGAVLLGDGQPYVTALLFVSPNALAELGVDEQKAVSTLFTFVSEALSNFSHFEQPKRIVVVAGIPSDHPEFVTPTLKLKRRPITEAYATEIAALYELTSGVGIVHHD
jgi:long-chain acyl-CoA synthetase